MTSPQRRAETAWFGAVLGIGAAAMLMISLFFAEAYLRASAEMWPPPGVPRLPRLLPSVNLVVLGAASAVLHSGFRRKGGAASVEESRSGDRSHRSGGAASDEKSRSEDRSYRSGGAASDEQSRSGDPSHRSGDAASDAQSRSFDRLRRDRSHRSGGAASDEKSRSFDRLRRDRSYRSSDAAALLLGGLFLALDALLWRTLLANGFTPARTGAYGALFFALSFAHAALVLLGILGLASLLLRPRAPARRGWTLYWDFLTVSFAAFVLGGIWL